MENKLPEGWKEYQIKDIGKVVTGNTPPKKDPQNYGGVLPWIKPPDLDKEKFVSVSEETISEIGRKKVRLLPKGSVLVSCIGNIGKAAIANTELCTNQQINSIIPNKNIVIPDFLYYSIKKISPYLKNIASSAVVPLLNKTDFSNVILTLPPVEIQQKIVAILEKAEETKKLRVQADKLAQRLLQNVFLEMFGDPVNNPKNWNKIKLGECIEFMTSGSRGWAMYYSDSGEKFIRIQNVKNGRLDFSDIQLVKPPNSKESIRTKVKDGDLLISITADLGRTAVVNEQIALEGAYINQHLALIRLNKNLVDPIFVSQYLESKGGKKQFSSLDQKGVKSGLNFESLKSLELYLPPLDEQIAFSALVKKLELIYQEQVKSAIEINNLFDVLNVNAFAGKLTT